MASKTKKSAPTLSEKAAEAICPNCGAETSRKSARGRAPVYCSSECRKQMAARDLNRGKALITAAMGWRVTRGSGETGRECMKELCSILDQFATEDRAAGRPRADLAAAKMLGTGYRYMDRKASAAQD